MKILITGASGFIGRALSVRLFQEGHELTLLLRSPKSLPQDWGIPCQTLIWDPTASDCPHDLQEFDALVHLMGESVAAARWTAARKQRLAASRALATRRIAEALQRRQQPLQCCISASAIGYYAYGDQPVDENSPAGQHFLAQICQDWEAAAAQIPAERRVSLRIGVVLGADGGAMERMRPIFSLGLGGRLASGQQWMSWIHRDDLLTIISSSLSDKRWSGVYNAVSPQPASNEEFTKSLGKALRRQTLMPTPAWALQLAFGEMSEILLQSQRVVPKRLSEQRFEFQYPDLQRALQDVCSVHQLGTQVWPCHRLESQQFVAKPLSEVFAFFSNPRNLERITPANLRFKIDRISTPEMAAGTIINYSLSLHGVPFHWQTLIERWEPNSAFVDNQEKGPYAIWHHTHRFYAVPGGTLMTDEVKYKVPLGFLGELFGLPFVRREVRAIFAHRRQVIAEIFKIKNPSVTG